MNAGKVVAELSSDELIKLSWQIWRNAGGVQSAFLKLFYHYLTTCDKETDRDLQLVLELAPELTDFESSALLAEYVVKVLPNGSKTDLESTRGRIESLRRVYLVRSHIWTHVSGSNKVPESDWNDPAKFRVDQEKLDALHSRLGSRSLRDYFEAMRTLLGLRSGLIKHKTIESEVPFEELYFPDRFEKTDEYGKFLVAEKLHLDE